MATVASIARPRVVLRFGDHPRSHRIERHIAGQLQRIGVRLNQDGLESSLEQMASPLPFDVEIHRVGPIDMPHDLRKIARGCSQQQMIMVAHQAPGMHDRSIPYNSRFHLGEKLLPIPLAREDILPFIASRRDMVQRAGIFDS